MATLISLAAIPTLAGQPSPPADSGQSVILVIGAEGTAEYGREFGQWADRWQEASKTGNAKVIRIGDDENQDQPDRERLRWSLAEAADAGDELWLVLIGHGTFDGREAKFNLRGPDVSAAELKEWLAPIKRPVAVVNCASASGPFVSALSAENRVVVTATKSGHEQNYARFGGFLSQSIADPSADLDKDGQISLLEAWLVASRRTAEFYSTEGRLETEHSLLDDNGDAQGTGPHAFRGIRPAKEADETALDGWRTHQWHLVRSDAEQRLPYELRRRRDELELAVIKLRQRKSEFTEEDYFARLERLLVPLAELYEQGERSFETGTTGGAIRLAGFEEPEPPPMPTNVADDEETGN